MLDEEKWLVKALESLLKIMDRALGEVGKPQECEAFQESWEGPTKEGAD